MCVVTSSRPAPGLLIPRPKMGDRCSRGRGRRNVEQQLQHKAPPAQLNWHCKTERTEIKGLLGQGLFVGECSSSSKEPNVSTMWFRTLPSTQSQRHVSGTVRNLVSKFLPPKPNKLSLTKLLYRFQIGLGYKSKSSVHAPQWKAGSRRN